LRQFSTLSRRQQARLPQNGARSLPSGSPVTFYRVRFRSPPLFSRRRIKNAILYSIPILAVFYALDIDLGEEEVEEEQKAKDGFTKVGDGEEEDEEEGLFIPFTWPTEQPRQFYKGSDPEWKEFIKFSKDIKKHKDVQRKWLAMDGGSRTSS
jgi:hypothetical protein